MRGDSHGWMDRENFQAKGLQTRRLYQREPIEPRNKSDYAGGTLKDLRATISGRAEGYDQSPKPLCAATRSAGAG
jgi:hypothetical protein